MFIQYYKRNLQPYTKILAQTVTDNLTHAVLRGTFGTYFVIVFSSISFMQNADIYLYFITILNAISKVWQA